jgi:hypothetical protein
VSEMKHTPLPWRIEGPDMFGDYNILPPKKLDELLAIGAIVSNLRPRDVVAANASIIVLAVNSHYALMEALEGILAAEEDFREGLPQEWEGDPLYDACQRARAALSAAKGET